MSIYKTPKIVVIEMNKKAGMIKRLITGGVVGGVLGTGGGALSGKGNETVHERMILGASMGALIGSAAGAGYSLLKRSPRKHSVQVPINMIRVRPRK